MNAEDIIIQNFMACVMVVFATMYGSYRGAKEKNKNAKFNWKAFFWLESAIIAGTVLSWIVLVK